MEVLALSISGLAEEDAMPRKQMPEIPKGDAIKRYNDGESMQSLRKSYGVSAEWLRKLFVSWGVEIRGVSDASVARGPVTWDK